MIDLDKIRAALRDSNVRAVARSTGLHPNVVYRFLKGGTQPRFETVLRLAKYIEGRSGMNG
jgi:DNA-binding phage protein